MELDDLVKNQHYAVSRSQALQHLTPAALRWQLKKGLWRTFHPGVYIAHAGPLTWMTRANAALLSCGKDSALALGSAAYLLGINDTEPQILNVHLPNNVSRNRPTGVRIRRRKPFVTVVRKGLRVTPPAMTVLDLGDLATASREDAIAVATRAVQRKKVTVEELIEKLDKRRAHRHRHALTLALGVVAEGAESVLEVDFVQQVLLAHGLPLMRMAVPDEVGGKSIRRDFVDDEHKIVLEVDGTIAHEGQRRRDNRRDRGTAAQGAQTLRAGWVDVYYETCELALDIFHTKQHRGFGGEIRQCGPTCAVKLMKRSA
ncbi:DUF559 domain-containing protein [Ammonicoccus fulvus]|uniref:DUF559 domain-containing protein n=1 Tax=Ammonicoccus fulvus TaxID=3138240 RepID=A0ABZ3FS14_9ACTN